ncbi:hypothetical protein JOF28_000179 [Leucobacter exalbidus]|uniref:Leucine rich repeat variant domain-containing protein n=1 Tax=Leucobacter exalbidus TaxID=662960 RepID=A0A940T2D6_9MICO|nr:hypothetical protein [Leucobacter exalbidus]MBP1324947.1 hypothetical protein [Leucobacter exalbidus]
MPKPPTPNPAWDASGAGVPTDASAEQLAGLAANRPDLWAQISAHPNCYDGLRDWIADNGGASQRVDQSFDATMTAASYDEETRTVAARADEQTIVARDFEATIVAAAPDPDNADAPTEVAAPDPVIPAAPPAPAITLMAPPAGLPMAPPSGAPMAPPSGTPMPEPQLPPPSLQMPPPMAAMPPAGVMPAAEPLPPMGHPAPPAGAAAEQPKRKKRKGAAWLAAGICAALVAAGGVALAVTGTWPFGQDSGGSAAAEVEDTGTIAEGDRFLNGLEAKWSIEGGDIGASASVSGYLPRMQGPINVAERKDQPVQLATGTLVSFVPSANHSNKPVSWAFIDGDTGAVAWTEDGLGRPDSCVLNDDHTEGVCATSEAQVVGFNAAGLTFRVPSELGVVQRFGDELRVLEPAAIVSRSMTGKELASEPVSGEAGWNVNNASNPDCVWLAGGDTVSYAGDGCSAPDDEVLVKSTTFTWDIAGTDKPVILIDDAQSLRAFDAESRKKLWTIDGALPGWYQAPQIVERESGDGVLVWKEAAAKFAVVDLRTGTETVVDTNVSDRNIAVSGGQVLAFSGPTDQALSEVAIFDGETGAEVYTGSFAEVTDVAEVIGGPAGVIFSHYYCTDCSTAEGSHRLDSYTFMGAVQGATAAGTAATGASLPGSITEECPAKTDTYAWAEFVDGWVLVCGLSQSEPTFMAYQEAGSSNVQYSVGATNPTSADAKAAVDWDAGLSRYTGEMANGDHITLDYEIGTMVRRDSANHKTLDQQRFVQYVFVPMGESVRTVQETSQQDGAFNVQAPEDTAQDQVRYMIEVLEKAYSGRALLKDALPKLQYCTASAGGYSDTVSAMEAVRDNRSELLSALDAMPVDKIPDGNALLDDLYEAIEASHRANVEYVAWAEAANASGCASLSSAGEAAAKASDAPKERFASRWNRSVAPTYGVRTFDAWYI